MLDKCMKILGELVCGKHLCIVRKQKPDACYFEDLDGRRTIPFKVTRGIINMLVGERLIVSVSMKGGVTYYQLTEDGQKAFVSAN